jgi:hypothetical protein
MPRTGAGRRSDVSRTVEEQIGLSRKVYDCNREASAQSH